MEVPYRWRLQDQRFHKFRISLLFILATGVLLYAIWLFFLLLRVPSDRVGVYFGKQIIVRQTPPDSPLRLDDAILRIGPLNVSDSPHKHLLTPGYWHQTLFASRNIQGMTYTILRAGKVSQIYVPWRPPTLRELLWRGGTLWLLSLVMIGVGFIMLTGRGRQLETRLLVLFFSLVALIQVNNVLPTSGANVALAWAWLFIPLDMLAVWFGVSAYLHAMLVFPEVKAPLRRYPWLLWVLHLTMPVASLTTAMLSRRETILGFRDMVFTVTNPLMVLAMLLGLAALAHTYLTSQQPGVRNQIRWILWGIAIGILPWILLYAVPSIVWGKPWLPLNITNAAGIVVPIAFMISIFRFGLLDIDLIVNRTLVYVASFMVLAAIYLGSVSVLRSIIMSVTGAPNDYLAGVIATLIIFLIFNPLRIRVQKIVDQTFYREQLDFRQVLHETGEVLSTTILFRDVVDLLTHRIADRLGLSNSTILLLDPTDQDNGYSPPGESLSDWGASLYVLKEAEIFREIVDAPLIHWMKDRHDPLLIYAAPQFHAVEKGRTVDHQASDMQLAVQKLARAGVEICIPLRQHNELLGVYLFGGKASGNLFNRQEVETLVLLGHQAAAALRNAQLYRELQEHNRMLETRVRARTAELSAERNRLDTILQNIADGLVVTDLKGQIVLTNPAFSQIVGMAKDVVLGHPLTQIFPSEALSNLIELALANPGEVFKLGSISGPSSVSEIDSRIVSNTGAADAIGRFYQASACALPGSVSGPAPDKNPLAYNSDVGGTSDVMGVVTILRDVTHEYEVDRMKTEFISDVSHELRTPLTSVLGFAKIISKMVDRDIVPRIAEDDRRGQRSLRRVQSNLEIIASEGDRLTRLINDVLDIAKMDAGKVDWHIGAVAMKDVIQSAVAATSSLVAEKDLAIVVEVAENLPTIQGDQDRLVQVITNLLSNAIKFTDEGQISVRAFTSHLQQDGNASPPIVGLGDQRSYLKPGDWLVVSVQDSGIGIPDSEMPQIFEKFKQVKAKDNVLSERPRGTGLGLPISREIISKHGGRIGVESKVGQGSIFAFVLPLEDDVTATQSMETAETPVTAPHPSTSETLTSYNTSAKIPLILVVDDDESMRRFLQQILTEAGYQVVEAENGMLALTIARQMRPNLIISDIVMPGRTGDSIDGFDVVSVLKNNPDTAAIPIIILSAIDKRERGFRLGIDNYLTKPVEADQILEAVSCLLQQEYALDKNQRLVMASGEACNE
jgi:signal transduction histidine kinase/CheY-like chemotaxis protein/GAF domain-containing protein